MAYIFNFSNYNYGSQANIHISGLLNTDIVTITLLNGEIKNLNWDNNYWKTSVTQYGMYIVNATRESKTITRSILVDAADTYIIPMSFGLYLYNCENGSVEANRCPSTSGGYHICYGWNYLGSRGYFNETANYMDIGDNLTGAYAGIIVQTNNLIDVTNFNSLSIDGYVVSHNTSDNRYSVFLSSNIITSIHYDLGVPSGGTIGNGSLFTRDTLELDISSITGSYYIGWECACGSTSNHTSTARIYKVWLS